MSDCRFGVSPVNYPDPDPDPERSRLHLFPFCWCTQSDEHMSQMCIVALMVCERWTLMLGSKFWLTLTKAWMQMNMNRWKNWQRHECKWTWTESDEKMDVYNAPVICNHCPPPPPPSMGTTTFHPSQSCQKPCTAGTCRESAPLVVNSMGVYLRNIANPALRENSKGHCPVH